MSKIILERLKEKFVTAPVVHGVHAGPGRAVLSFALRVGLPLAGFALAKAASKGCWNQPDASDTCEIGAGVAGLFVGVVGAEILDVAWLARDRHPAEPPARAAPAAGAQLVFLPTSDGGSVGLVGRF